MQLLSPVIYLWKCHIFLAGIWGIQYLLFFFFLLNQLKLVHYFSPLTPPLHFHLGLCKLHFHRSKIWTPCESIQRFWHMYFTVRLMFVSALMVLVWLILCGMFLAQWHYFNFFFFFLITQYLELLKFLQWHLIFYLLFLSNHKISKQRILYENAELTSLFKLTHLLTHLGIWVICFVKTTQWEFSYSSLSRYNPKFSSESLLPRL